MTIHEFNQKVKEYDKMRTEISESDYALIEHVYCFHPSISDAEGKRQVALLYCEFGMRIFQDMKATADKAEAAEKRIQFARTALAAALDEYEAIKEGRDKGVEA